MKAYRLVTACQQYEIEEVMRFEASGKVKYAAEWRAAGGWDRWIGWHPRPLRLRCFLEIMDELSTVEYWRLLADIWTDVEAPKFNRAAWLELFMSDRGNHDYLMSAESRRAFDSYQIVSGFTREQSRSMPEVWRGRLICEWPWFEHRVDVSGHLFVTVIPKRKVLAYFDSRNEHEIVIDPRRIALETMNLTPDWIADAAARAAERRTANEHSH